MKFIQLTSAKADVQFIMRVEDIRMVGPSLDNSGCIILDCDNERTAIKESLGEVVRKIQNAGGEVV